MKKITIFVFVLMVLSSGWVLPLNAQHIIEHALLCTFGPEAPTDWGDEDFNQVIFVAVPTSTTEPFYLRIYDAGCRGDLDEINNQWNTTTEFRAYGGQNAYTDADGRSVNPTTGLQSGTLLDSFVAGQEQKYNNQWTALGPFNATDGEIVGEEAIFKLVIEGKSGDDGNLYNFEVSHNENSYRPIANVRIFAYEVSFQLPLEENRVTRIPLLPEKPPKKITAYNFDADTINRITLNTPDDPSIFLKASGDDEWASTTVNVNQAKGNYSANFGKTSYGNNDIVFYAEDEGGNLIPLGYPLPILPFEVVEAKIESDMDCNTIYFDGSASTDINGDLLTYTWDLGDGTKKTGMQVSHSYPKSGDYPIMLTVTDNSGAVCAVSKTVVSVNINTPPVADAGADLTGCPNETVTFSGIRSQDPDGLIADYQWDFGDGSTGKGATPTHTYKQPGTYTVNLTVTDNSKTSCNTATDQMQVTINTPPIADAGPDQTVGTTTVVFDGTASQDPDFPNDPNALIYTWDFGDGSPGKQGQTPFHTYYKPGRYTVTLTVTDRSNTNCNIDTDTMLLIINHPPKANAGDNIVGCIGEAIQFDAGRSEDVDGTIDSYKWSFGDGSVGEGINPTHVYEKPGVYTATLSVLDNTGTLNSRDTDVMTVIVNNPPTANAGADKIVCTNMQVAFDATNSYDIDGRVIRYEWDFGDGTTGEGARPVHAYTEPGEYTVLLTVYDDSEVGCNLNTDELVVTVNQPPIAEAGPDQLVCTSLVTFDATQSTDPDGVITQYLWDFGDGSKGIGSTISHIYPDDGTYVATLTVKDNSGTVCDSHSDITTVTINKTPIADGGNDQITCVGETISFDGSGSLDPDGEITAYRWDFGDGSTPKEGPTVTHTYEKSGNYRVTLMVTDDSGTNCAKDTDDITVRVNMPPVAEAGTERKGCVDEAILFDGGASYDPDGSARRYTWDFGDGSPVGEAVNPSHVYTSPGVYTVTLTVFDNSGTTCNSATDQTRVVINEMPIADAGDDINTCQTTITFDGSKSADPDMGKLSYHWDFGDGTTGGGMNPTHTYAEPGVYPVTLKVMDDSGTRCNNFSDNMTVTINQPPVANAGIDQIVCLTDMVTFNGSQSTDPDGGTLNYEWDFGDGSPPATGVISPVHQYTKGGIYEVTLTVNDNSGVQCNTSVDKVSVQVVESPYADAGEPQTVCSNTRVYFDGSKSRDLDGEVNSFQWDFGDGSTGGGMNPTHVYTKAGEYTVTLTIRGDDLGNCTNTDTDVTTIIVHEAPTTIAGDDMVGCVNQSLQFDGTGSVATTPIAQYQWDFGDGNTGQGATPTHTYSEPGVYNVVLTCTDNSTTDCNQTSDNLVVTINHAPVADAGEETGVTCINDVIVFDGMASYDADGFITRYEWDFGDGMTNEGVSPNHVYKTAGIFTATLTVYDNSGVSCNTDTDTRIITVNHPPMVDAGPEQIVCPGEAVQLNGGSSGDPDGQLTRYEWDLGDGNTGIGSQYSHTYQAPGIYQAALKVTDDSKLYCNVGTGVTRIIVNQSPVAEAGGDKISCAGEMLMFDGSRSIDIDGELVQYQWDFGDGSTADGAKPNHAYAAAGTYTVTLTVTDNSGTNCGTNTDQLTVIVNEPPVAVITAEGDHIQACVGCAKDEVEFDGSQSYDPEGGRLTFQWDFGDGTTGIGVRPVHTYTEPGTYTLTLTVYDDSGTNCNSATTSIPIKVNRAPDPDIQIRSERGKQ